MATHKSRASSRSSKARHPQRKPLVADGHSDKAWQSARVGQAPPQPKTRFSREEVERREERIRHELEKPPTPYDKLVIAQTRLAGVNADIARLLAALDEMDAAKEVAQKAVADAAHDLERIALDARV